MTMKRRSIVLMLFVLPLFLTGCQPAQEPADLVLRGGKVVTVDESKPEAEAVAIRGDTIVAVGTNDEIEPYIGSDEVIELDGNWRFPGSSKPTLTSWGWAGLRCSSS